MHACISMANWIAKFSENIIYKQSEMGSRIRMANDEICWTDPCRAYNVVEPTNDKCAVMCRTPFTNDKHVQRESYLLAKCYCWFNDDF